MPPQTNSIVNMYTVDPDMLCRKPIYVDKGVPSNKHILCLKGVEGAAGNACLQFFGRVKYCFLRAPASSYTTANIRHRGIFISAYKANLKRFQELIAHTAGKREDFVLPYGSSHLALTQFPEFTNMCNGNAESVDVPKMKHPFYWQDASSSERFNFKFPIHNSFNRKSKHDDFAFLMGTFSH